jgi:hypothetical protein
VTAYRSDEQLFRGYDLGAVDFLFKPIIPEILQSKIQVFVKLSSSQQLLRRKAEEMARAEQQFRSVLEAAPDAMVITNQAGGIQLANSRTDALFGYSREALIGSNIRLLIPEWESPEIGAKPSPESPPELRRTGIRRDRSSFTAQFTRNSFKAFDGHLITTAIRDVTDQADAEVRIQRANLELEKRVAERTAALTSSNEALRQFTWAASHDLQEPIRTVLTYSQWLSKTAGEKLGSREQQMLSVIEQHAGRLHQLLGGLRQYIQVSDSGDRVWGVVDCRSAVKSAVWNLQQLLDETGTSIEHGELPTLHSIELLLVQVFQNLISNSVKYRTNAPPVIKISAEKTENGWTFSVRDNGIGIDPKYSEYIFGVFRRLQGTEHAGAGIGLAICRAAVEQLGGRIWVESALGAGATFHFTLPLEPAYGNRANTNFPS